MEKNQLCFHCEKNTATVSRSEYLNGSEARKYYCLSCYQTLFLTRDFTVDASSAIEIDGQKACAVCKRTAREFFATGLVGCANCYKALAKEIYPTILKMQGDKAHCGAKHIHSEKILKLLDERDAIRSSLDDTQNSEQEQKLEYIIKKIEESSDDEEGI